MSLVGYTRIGDYRNGSQDAYDYDYYEEFSDGETRFNARFVVTFRYIEERIDTTFHRVSLA
jgi:hypothetical protein